MKLRTHTSAESRRKALEKESGVTMPHTGAFTLDEAVAANRNCENMIGATQVPVGVAGPLRITSVNTAITHRAEYYLPLATTEGALVASVNRGCKAITESGGAVVAHHRAGASRGPVFRVDNLAHSERFYTYVREHFSELQKVAAATSGHLRLVKLIPRGVGKYRYVRFMFDTQDAMGMNMVTIASQALASHIEQATGATCVSVAGNFDTDKKPAWLNAIENRGIKVWAEVTVPQSVLSGVLKTTAQRVYEVWLAKCMIGSAVSGSMGFNAQYANVVAALFLATGQDIGHVGEASVGITTAEVVDGGDLYMQAVLPDLMVGTVGGGTGLATQKEALELLGVAGGDSGKHAETFAEIVGAAVLAGELSLLSSLEEGSLTRAHERLARGKK